MPTITSSCQGLLLDMDGVLYVDDIVLDGAREAIQWLREHQIPLRFITNTTTRTPKSLMNKLSNLRLDIRNEEVFTAVTATLGFLHEQGQPSCHLLLRDEIKPLFKAFSTNHHSPDYVVIGDIGATWNYQTLNEVFNMLMQGTKLICMHRNKFWQGTSGLKMDIGAFVAALEYVADTEAMVIGKPSTSFFQQALKSIGTSAEHTFMVGDDIDSDIGGCQACGLTGILVKTGKYRQAYVEHTAIKPNYVIDSIRDIPDLLSYDTTSGS